jgi:hypothetical protein
MYPRPLVPPDFVVPALRTDRFELHPLGLDRLVVDYEGIVATGAHLDGRLAPPGLLGAVSGFSLADDIVELAWHEREFAHRASFAFIALPAGGDRSLGGVYVNPADRGGFEAECYSWGRYDPAQPDLDAHLFGAFRAWVHDAWPFERVAFPGRDQPWADWLALPLDRGGRSRDATA